MKSNFLKSLFFSFIGMASTSAFAGGIECRTCPCPEGLNYIPKSDCNIRTPGLFCVKNDKGIQGWSISKEAISYIDSLAGLPNAETSYHILPSPIDSSFNILEMTRYGDVVSTSAKFYWIGSTAISDGTRIFKLDCESSK
jgi:hypothetical protein